ncbi:MAG: hypothetical protein JST90_01920 [Bacteroidetes bacterium]|nr:hypothetical protein [Bacteroidota bacterium]
MLKVILTTSAVILLLFNGIGALYGGLSFMLHPDGSGLGMSVEYLRYSPFSDFFVPGLILFTCNGVFSLVAIALVVFSHRYAAWAVLLQGVILVGWIAVQVLMVRDFQELHAVMLGTGVLLAVCGVALRKYNH